MSEREFAAGDLDVMDLTTADRFAVCERETRHIIIEQRPSGVAHYMTYKTERGARLGLARAEVVIRDTPLMVVDREAE